MPIFGLFPCVVKAVSRRAGVERAGPPPVDVGNPAPPQRSGRIGWNRSSSVIPDPRTGEVNEVG